MSIITSIIIVASTNTKRNARCVTMTIFFRHYTKNSSFVKTSVNFKKCFPLNKRVNLRRKNNLVVPEVAQISLGLSDKCYLRKSQKTLPKQRKILAETYLIHATLVSFVTPSTKDYEFIHISFSSRHSCFLLQPQIKCCSLLGFKRFTLTSSCLYIQGRYGWYTRTHFIINDYP